MLSKLHDKRFLLIIFTVLLIEGFNTISLEILSIRQLLPFFGSSVIITSLIIGVFLLFLAIGYYLGGKSEGKELQRLQRNFNISAILCGLGLSYPFCELSFYFAEDILNLPLLLELALYLLLILAPLTALLGQTLPIATNFFNQKTNSVSQISSQALFLSTLGSFLGAVLTSILLLNYFGVAATLFFNSMLLLLLATLLAFNIKKLPIKQMLFTALCLTGIYSVTIGFEKKEFMLTNNYANYSIADFNSTGAKNLIANNMVMSTVQRNQKAALVHETLKKVLFDDLKLKDKSILVAGAGGFTLSFENTFGNEFTYVDIDRALKPISEQHFLKQPIKGVFFDMDIRAYFNTHKKTFEAIVLDTFSRESIPASLTTQEYFKQIKEHLMPQGYALFNVISSPFLKNQYEKHFDNTLTSVFKNCLRIPMSFTDITNVLYICQKRSNEADPVIYTDNHNQSSSDQFSFLKDFRNYRRTL